MERMDTPQRSSAASVIRHLLQAPYDFSFLQAVRIFERLLPEPNFDKASHQLTFDSRYTYSLPSSDLYAIKMDGHQPVIEVKFLNIAGPHGPLPNPLSEIVIERMREGDFALKDFLGIFNHRFMALYYAIAQKYSFVLSPTTFLDSTAGQMVAAVAGANAHQSHYLSLPTQVLATYAGVLWQHPRSAAGLGQILSDYFQVPISIEQCVGQWIDIHRRQRTFIGHTNGRNHRLGKATFLGRRYWQSGSHFIVHVGPLTAVEFQEFIPTGQAYIQMCDLIKCYAPMELSFQLKMHLKDGETLHSPVLDGDESAQRLGWTAVLHHAPTDYHVTIQAA